MTDEKTTADGFDHTTDAAAPAETVSTSDETAAPEAEPTRETSAPAVGSAAAADEDGSAAHDVAPAVPPQYGVGPLSIREVALVGVWALAFIVSFFPIYGRIGIGSSVWTAGIDWVLTIGVPTAAVFLILLRRFSPQGIRRVGSLGIDQFASVAFAVSATIWLGIVWGAFVALAQTRVFLATWVVWVELILMLAGVVLTVAAPHLPVLGEDFRHRPDAPAHRLARATRPVVARPAPVHAAASAAAPAPQQGAAEGAYGVPATQPVGSDIAHDPSATGTEPRTQAFAYVADSSDDATQSSATGFDGAEAESAAPQAFWALAPEERDVVDEQGAPLFRVGPLAWALVIEDRGGVFVVRHEDGRVGFLHETADVTRG